LKKKILISKQKSFLEWKKSLKKNSVKINKIKYKSLVNRNNCDFTLSTIDTELVYHGKKYNRAVQLEGTSVVIIPILYYKKRIMTVLVSQFRAPLGRYTMEFPSGGADSKKLKESAKKEIMEELGMNIPIKNISKLNKKGIFLLPANNYSRAYFFYFKKFINEKTLKQMRKKTYGKKEEGEFIKLKLLDFKNLLNVSDSASVIIGHSLVKHYEILQK